MIDCIIKLEYTSIRNTFVYFVSYASGLPQENGYLPDIPCKAVKNVICVHIKWDEQTHLDLFLFISCYTKWRNEQFHKYNKISKLTLRGWVESLAGNIFLFKVYHGDSDIYWQWSKRDKFSCHVAIDNKGTLSMSHRRISCVCELTDMIGRAQLWSFQFFVQVQIGGRSVYSELCHVF